MDSWILLSACFFCSFYTYTYTVYYKKHFTVHDHLRAEIMQRWVAFLKGKEKPSSPTAISKYKTLCRCADGSSSIPRRRFSPLHSDLVWMVGHVIRWRYDRGGLVLLPASLFRTVRVVSKPSRERSDWQTQYRSLPRRFWLSDYRVLLLLRIIQITKKKRSPSGIQNLLIVPPRIK